MKRFIILALFCSLNSWGHAATKGVTEILILHDVDYLSFGKQLSHDLKNESQRTSALNVLAQMHHDLKRLSMSELSIQLKKWQRIREQIPIETLQDILSSNTIGIFINDTILSALLNLAQTDQKGKFLQLTLPQQEFLKGLSDICQKNWQLTVTLRPQIHRVIGGNPNEETQNLFYEIIMTVEELSKKKYLSKWGENVLALRQSSDQDVLPKGLLSLGEHTAITWKEITEGPRNIPAKAYFVAVDLYTTKTLNAVNRLLDYYGITNMADKRARKLWEAEMLDSPPNELNSIYIAPYWNFKNVRYNKLLLLQSE